MDNRIPGEEPGKGPLYFDKHNTLEVGLDFNPNTGKECVRLEITIVEPDKLAMQKNTWYLTAEGAEKYAAALSKLAEHLRRNEQRSDGSSGPSGQP